jgi:hypothetical protein
VTGEGVPVRVVPARRHRRPESLGRVIIVVDRGFSYSDDLAYPRRAGGHSIAGMRMRASITTDRNACWNGCTGPALNVSLEPSGTVGCDLAFR